MNNEINVIKQFHDNTTVISKDVTGFLWDIQIISWCLSNKGFLFYKWKYIETAKEDNWRYGNMLPKINTPPKIEDRWSPYDRANFGISIRLMKRIVSEFGNLIAFI